MKFFNKHFYKLVENEGGNTIEIDGVRMHKTKDMTPIQDAAKKVKAVGVKKGDRVLDICTGLGYSAIASMRKGARVTSIEWDENVLEVAKANPDSKELFSGKIKVVVGDAFELVPGMKPSSFDRVVLDPPTFKFSPLLYSLEFYRNLIKVIRPGGTLLHYTGEPGSRFRKKSLKKGVMNRLREAGFVKLEWIESIACVRARKRA